MMKKEEVVFIVDDDPMHAQMMEDYLASKFATIKLYIYKTGEECNENMDKNPGIIILDYHLNAVNKSARDGAQILEHIKRKYEETEVIMISGQDKIDVAIDCMRLGAFDYIVKNETSFFRTETAINRLFKHRLVLKNILKYKRINRLFGWVIFGIVLLTIILTASGKLKMD